MVPMGLGFLKLKRVPYKGVYKGFYILSTFMGDTYPNHSTGG